jgi:hypothetical protein
MVTFLTQTAALRPKDMLSETDLTSDGAAGARNVISGWVKAASSEQRLRLKNLLNDSGLHVDGPLDMFLEREDEADRVMDHLSNNLDLLETLDQNDSKADEIRSTLSYKDAFTADETQALKDGAGKVAAREAASTIVMGHTHESVEQKNSSFTYFNTGSWTRYYVFEKNERTAPWQVLREDSYERFPYSLRYTLVKPGAGSATLETWQERSKA